jgi:hypothetical protein
MALVDPPIRITLGPEVVLYVGTDTAKHMRHQLAASGGDSEAGTPPRSFPDEHSIWTKHSGGDPHRNLPEWSAGDEERAETYYGLLTSKEKAHALLDFLIDHPGELLTTDEIQAALPDVFASSRSIAGSINGMTVLTEQSGRRYPFYWWEGSPSRYGTKPSVAELFRRARDAFRSW